MRMTWTRMLCLVGFLAVAGMAQPSTEESTAVVLVEVPVQVVSRDGAPIEGLGIDNFELTDRRKKRQILSFEQVDLRGDTEGDLPWSARRRVLFFFDLASSDPVSIQRARDGILKILDGELHRQDLAALATYSPSRGLRMLANFTADHASVAEAVSTMVEAEGLGRIGGIGVSGQDIDRGSRGRAGGEGADNFAEGLEKAEAAVNRTREAETLNEIRALEGFADALARLDGRKQMIFLSRGLDLQLPPSTMGDTTANLDRARGESVFNTSEESFGSSRLQTASEAMVDRFRKGDCAIYTVDISQQQRVVGAGADSRRSSLVSMARGTGGEFYSNFNDLSAAVGRMIERTSVTYLLSFQPDDLEGNGDYRKLKIKLKNVPGRARVSYRSGYFDRLPKTGELPQQYLPPSTLSEQKVSRRDPGEVAIELLAVPTNGVIGGKGMSVMLRIPGADVMELAEESVTGFDVTIEARAENGTTASVHETFGLNVDQIRGQIEGAGVLFYGYFDLAPGNYQVRARLLLGADGRRGEAIASVIVNGSEGGAPSISVPLFPDPLDRWPMARQAAPIGEKSIPFPFMLRGEPFLPAVRPEIDGRQPTSFCLLPHGIEGSDLELGGEIRGPDGEIIGPADLIFLRRTGGGLDGIDCLLAELRPENLEPGDYRLSLAVSDSITRKELAESEIAFTVVSRSDQLSGVPGFPQQPAGQPREAVARIDEKRVEKEYRDLLALLADGQHGEAGRALIRLEESVVSESGHVPEALRKVELKVGKALAWKRVESLIPVLGLHSAAYETYISTGRTMMAIHSRFVITALSERYTKKARKGETSVVGALVFSRIASYVAEAGAHSVSQMHFERALKLDPGNEAAAVGLGALLEKMGEYEDMVRVLKNYLKVGGKSYEARLRLALGLARVGKSKDAVALLRELAGGPEPVQAWMISITYQELGKLLLASDQNEQAAELFARGVEKRPQDQALAILLTYAQNRDRRSGGAERLVAHLERGSTAESPRYRYNLWPVRAFERNRLILVEKAELRLANLTQALGTRSAGATS